LSFAITYLAIGDSADAFWGQLLVVVVLAAGAGVYSLIRTHKAKYAATAQSPRDGQAGRLTDRLKEIAPLVRDWLIRFTNKTKISHDEPITLSIIEPAESPIEQPQKAASNPLRTPVPGIGGLRLRFRKRVLTSGMELLDSEFLAATVEKTDSADRRDIAMRCLCFNELIRRDQLGSIAGPALKVYTLDEDGFYGKTIRCEAMKELATRTGPGTACERRIELQQIP